jgi:D-beta-D-heptose 7-phosphate kinase/D-beta-D-heptose 1-phosphate adenosyltransferase
VKLDFSAAKILVIGDPMMDVYHFGHVDRISPEAPVPIFVQDRRDALGRARLDYRPGGAQNVVMQLQALGCQVDDAYKSTWTRQPKWTEKHRYMVGHYQLFREDIDRHVPNTVPALEGFSAVIISDYAKGACTFDVCQEAIHGAFNLKIPVIVDPKGSDWDKYRNATVICPNEQELDIPYAIRDRLESELVIKMGAKGLHYHGHLYPATAKHVFDVTGAGDTVTAVIAACLAVGMTLPEACPIANAAAGYVVGEIGTTVCPIEELQKLCS